MVECGSCKGWYHFDFIENKKGKVVRKAAEVAASSETTQWICRRGCKSKTKK
jgi:hypothetical protein